MKFGLVYQIFEKLDYSTTKNTIKLKNKQKIFMGILKGNIIGYSLRMKLARWFYHALIRFKRAN
jgi:hypothetical protein